jgi:hypothetical protein
MRVCFVANPVARALYERNVPQSGECGTVTTVPVPGGRRTCMPGPRGGLVYVDWDRSSTSGVFRVDLKRESTGKSLAGRRRLRRAR